MKEKTETFNQGKRYFFYILMFAILGWFIFMQIFGADERSSDTSAASVIYSGTVTWQKPDGTTQEISVPGTYKVPVGDTTKTGNLVRFYQIFSMILQIPALPSVLPCRMWIFM